ncbi:hypothetical protein OJHNALOF_02725 [Oceanimonas sp. MB9]|nr:hypothetical protein [Oceanimonas sp. MB9]
MKCVTDAEGAGLALSDLGSRPRLHGMTFLRGNDKAGSKKPAMGPAFVFF